MKSLINDPFLYSPSQEKKEQPFLTVIRSLFPPGFVKFTISEFNSDWERETATQEQGFSFRRPVFEPESRNTGEAMDDIYMGSDLELEYWFREEMGFSPIPLTPNELDLPDGEDDSLSTNIGVSDDLHKIKEPVVKQEDPMLTGGANQGLQLQQASFWAGQMDLKMDGDEKPVHRRKSPILTRSEMGQELIFGDKEKIITKGDTGNKKERQTRNRKRAINKVTVKIEASSLKQPKMYEMDPSKNPEARNAIAARERRERVKRQQRESAEKIKELTDKVAFFKKGMDDANLEKEQWKLKYERTEFELKQARAASMNKVLILDASTGLAQFVEISDAVEASNMDN